MNTRAVLPLALALAGLLPLPAAAAAPPTLSVGTDGIIRDRANNEHPAELHIVKPPRGHGGIIAWAAVQIGEEIFVHIFGKPGPALLALPLEGDNLEGMFVELDISPDDAGSYLALRTGGGRPDNGRLAIHDRTGKKLAEFALAHTGGSAWLDGERLVFTELGERRPGDLGGHPMIACRSEKAVKMWRPGREPTVIAGATPTHDSELVAVEGDRIKIRRSAVCPTPEKMGEAAGEDEEFFVPVPAK